MIKPNDRPTLNQPINISVNFTFATPKSKKKNQQDRHINSAEKKVVAMWLGTVLELHSDEFVLALKSSRKFSVVELSKYLSKYYPHLKTIVQYYIIAALIDYQLIVSDIHEESSLDKQCPFINIVIEELASRFFVESQWLHKISYLPIYRIFPLFDHYSKGYTTVSELRNMVKQDLTAKPVKTRVSFQKQQRLKLKKQKLLNLKLKNNIQGQDVNIYQENVEQIMLRVNLVHFEQKPGAASQRYESIKRILQDYDHFITEKYQKECEQMVREEIKHKEQLQIMKENQKIKQRSNLMSKANQQKQNQNALNKQNQIDKAEYSYKVPESIFSTMPHNCSNLIASKPQNLDSSLISRNRQLGKQSTLNYDNASSLISRNTAVRTQGQVEQVAVMGRVEEEMKENMPMRQNQLHHELVDENLKQIQKNERVIQYRNSILEQLQFIREQKKTNYFRLLNYI